MPPVSAPTEFHSLSWRSLAQPERLALLALVLAVILFAIPAHKPLYLDNVEFPYAAKAAAEKGVPVYYRGEEIPRLSGLYHPPLYIYLLAAWFKFWGFGEAQARWFSFLCVLLHGGIVLYGMRVLLGSETAKKAAPFFWIIFLLNPYTLQGAAVLDIDNTIYGPILAGMLAALLRLAWKEGQPREDAPCLREWGVVALLTAVALWAKLTTVLSVMPLAVLLPARRLGLRGAALAGGGAVAAGVALFLASYALYGLISGLDVTFSFRFLLFSFRQRSGTSTGLEWLAAHWQTFRDMIHWQVLWTGLFPWAVAVFTLLWLGRRWLLLREPRARDATFVLGWALFVTAFYCGLTYTFGRAPFKYVYVAWGILCAVLAAWQAAAWDRLREWPGMRVGWTAWILAAACFLISGKWLRDRFILEGTLNRADLAMLALPVLLALAGFLMWRRSSGALLYHHGTFAYVGTMLGLALAMARAPYPTTYDYGQEGFDDTVCFIRQHTAPEEVIISMKDVGFRAGRRFFENYQYVFGSREWVEKMRSILLDGKARYAVFTEGNGPDNLALNPALGDVIRSLCVQVRQYGHYRIYDCADAPRRAAAR
jgi:hypothetical protein